MEVKGSKPNEELTAFRLENKDKGLVGIREAAVAFMTHSPSSPVSVFLFKEYFLLANDVSQDEVKKHYRALCEAQPDNLLLLSWQSDIENRGRLLKKGSSLPDFVFTLKDGRKVQASDYRGKPLLVNFWASWKAVAGLKLSVSGGC